MSLKKDIKDAKVVTEEIKQKFEETLLEVMRCDWLV